MKVLSQRDVCAATSLSFVTIWRLRRAGTFPQPIRLSAGRIGWRSDEVEAWLAERAVVGV
jgi:prophage regulatory protein